MKIVIVSMSGIGNLIHTTPCAIALRSMGHQVVICTWPRSVDILRNWEIAHITINHPAAYTLHADHVIISKCGAIWQDEWAGNAKVWRAGPDKNPWVKHEIEYYMDVARELGYQGETPNPEICIDRNNRVLALNTMERASLKPKKFVCISAGYIKKEHWPLKHWGDENYSELLYRIQWNGWDVVFVGSKEDRDVCERIIEGKTFFCSDTCNINYCGFFEDIKNTAALIEQSMLVIGNDGGLMHVAAAVGVPTLTIFTFTNPVKNKPYVHGRTVMVDCEDRLSCQHGEWKRCIQRGCLNVPIEAVWEQSKRFIEDLQSRDGDQDAAAIGEHLEEFGGERERDN